MMPLLAASSSAIALMALLTSPLLLPLASSAPAPPPPAAVVAASLPLKRFGNASSSPSASSGGPTSARALEHHGTLCSTNVAAAEEGSVAAVDVASSPEDEVWEEVNSIAFGSCADNEEDASAPFPMLLLSLLDCNEGKSVEASGQTWSKW